MHTTIFQNFEEGENCESIVSVENTIGYDMNLFEYDMKIFVSDMKLFGSGFKFQELSVMLVPSLINFGVKNQVPQVSFKIVARDLISFHALRYDMNLFGYYMILFGSDMLLFGSSFKFQEPPVILVAVLIIFGVKNQVPKVSSENCCWRFDDSFLS